MKTLLSIGHGYSARAFANRLLAEGGWKVIGTTRSEEKAAEIRATGAEAVVWPGSSLAPYLQRATHLLISVAPDEGGGGDAILRELGQPLPLHPSLCWVGYLSTTGVYGDRAGEWVDENSDCLPNNARSQRRLEAEQAWVRTGLPVHLFRLAGIYGPGPGRNTLDRVQSGSAQRVIKPNQYFSRIHVADIAAVLHASINLSPAQPPGTIYNVCDNEPTPPQDVIEYAASLLRVPLPVAVDFEDAKKTMTSMARSFYEDSKRVANRKIREELKVVLLFPTYREGLADCLRGMAPGGAQL